MWHYFYRTQNQFQGCFTSSIFHRMRYWETSPSWKYIILCVFCIGPSKLCTLWSIPTSELKKSLRKEDEEQFNELKKIGFGSGFTEYVFLAIHCDLVPEPFNKETKGTSGPFRWIFSINIDSVNTWVNTIHIYPSSCLKTAITSQILFKA